MMASPAPALSAEELQTLLDGPAGSTPAGVFPDFEIAVNPYRLFALATALCLISSTLVVLMRLYTKAFIIRSFAYEDCRSLIRDLVDRELD
jgi:hypothetical protein